MKILSAFFFISLLATGTAVADTATSDWESLDELKAWLEEDTPSVILIADSSGRVSFDGQCEDTAISARDRAHASGKWLETEILTRQECIRYRAYVGSNPYRMRHGGGHYINKAVIGNAVYYVNVITDKVWFAYNLD